MPRGTHVPARSPRPFAYRTVTFCGDPFQWSSARARFSHSVTPLRRRPASRTTPTPQRPQAITRNRFGLLRFRSPLLTEYSLFLQVLRCFSSLAYLRHAYSIQRAVTRLFTSTGFPIRTSTDQKPAGDSPWLFAANHVLLRPIVPRHPPCALRSFPACVHARFLDSCSTVKVPPNAFQRWPLRRTQLPRPTQRPPLESLGS